ncbi:Glutamate receptor ionotropic like protein [Argiope bruennichi]|uniref:Glutamate receptor ionotropic like protein n=1 Tax=Argiope bruennichi TaxID=94029 RepID=A0A8T0EWE7_ARGBR|nr:Glutamate receptor ionotropic like protein [Argiope bruennichi]
MKKGTVKTFLFPSSVTVGYIPNKYVFEANIINGTLQLGGIEGRFLDLISKTLGFTYRLKFPLDREIGTLYENGSWTGLIGMLQRKETDMALNFLIRSEQRAKTVDFSDFYEMSDIRFLVDKPGVVPSKWSLFYPFNIATWICILLILLIVPKLVIFILNLRISYTKLFFEMLGTFLQQSFTIKLNSPRSNTVLFPWIVFAMMVSLFYSSTLLSFITIPLEEPPLENFEELSQAVAKGTYRCFGLKGSHLLPALLTSEQEHLRILGKVIKEKAWFLDKNDELKNLKEILTKSAIIDNRFKLEILHNTLEYDSYVLSRDPLVSIGFVIALRKDFCCERRLNVIISRIKRAGLYQKLEKEELFRIFLSKNETIEENNSLQLKIYDFFGAFMFLMIGYFLSLLTLLCETIYFRLRIKH